MHARQVYPLPEILIPGSWTIRHSARGGHTVPKDRLLVVPLADSPFARGLRAHEMAHVRFSPERIRHRLLRVRLDTLLAVEDARVNEGACRAGLREVLAPLDDPAAGHVDPRDDLRTATLLLVAAHGTQAFARLWDVYGSSGGAGSQARRIAEEAVAVLRDAPSGPDFRLAVAVARSLDRIFGPEGESILPRLGCASAADASHARRDGYPGSAEAADVPWGELREIEEPPRPLRSGAGAARRRATDEGAVLHAPHRFLLDRRVFARRRRLPGGTLLIDGSGSMRLERKGILALLAAAPGAQVARYDGSREGDWGRIRILVRGGWRVVDELLDEHCCGPGNVIDGPALRWLARQPGPRLWVSDGGVTGVGDRACAALTEEAQALCRAHGIVEVADARAARRALASW